MGTTELKGLSITTGTVKDRSLGYIMAIDPDKTERDVEHTVTFRWKDGKFTRGEVNFSTRSCMVFNRPEFGYAKASSEGDFSVLTARGNATGNVFAKSKPQPTEPRFGGTVESLGTISERVYAVGLEGSVFRLDKSSRWTRIDQGLSRSFAATAVDGFDESRIFAVGYAGECWKRIDETWSPVVLPTDADLISLCCGGDGNVYAAGRNGTLVVGGETGWVCVKNPVFNDTITALAWSFNRLFVSTMKGLYVFANGKFSNVDFGRCSPKSFYHLSCGDGVLWSIGSKNVLAYDGQGWSSIVG